MTEGTKFHLSGVSLSGIAVDEYAVTDSTGKAYVERSRELATLKVLGFRDRHIGKLLISQNIWLTLLGVILGLPSGIGVLQALLTTLAEKYELKLCLGVLTYSVSLLVTFGVSLAVSLMVAGKSKKIDIVGSLKGAE